MKTCAYCGRENADEAVDCRECRTQEFKTPEGKANAALVVRVIAAVGCLVFLGLALKMGAESFHARSVGSPMGNWKGGTMEYSDGFKLTAIFGCHFAGENQPRSCGSKPATPRCLSSYQVFSFGQVF